MYCISEAQLETLLAGCQNDYGEWCKGVDDAFGETIRSHPLSKELKKERESVLKLVYDRYVNAYLNPDNYNEINAKEVYKYIESLRSEQP